MRLEPVVEDGQGAIYMDAWGKAFQIEGKPEQDSEVRVRPAEKRISKGLSRAEAKSRKERRGPAGWGAWPVAWTLRDAGPEEDSGEGMVGSGVCPVAESARCGEDGAPPAAAGLEMGVAKLGRPEAPLVGFPLGAEVV